MRSINELKILSFLDSLNPNQALGAASIKKELDKVNCPVNQGGFYNTLYSLKNKGLIAEQEDYYITTKGREVVKQFKSNINQIWNETYDERYSVR